MGQLQTAERFCKAYNQGTAFQVVVRQVVSSASQALRVKRERNTKYGEITFFFLWDSLMEKASEKFGTCQTQPKHAVGV